MAHFDRKLAAMSKSFSLLFLKKEVLLLLSCLPTLALAADERARWQAEAEAVTIVRDDWGIAHIHADTDADAVFGMVYAQAEDDFNRVETNYLTALGRMSEAEGSSRIYRDLRQRLFIDPDALKADYASSPDWLKALMNSWADGLNLFLATHPKITPRVITHFEPWMALSFSEGSIGGDIERVNLAELEAFLWPQAVASCRDRYGIPRAGRFERHRHSTGQHGGSSRAAVNQSAHQLLFPRRAAGDEQ